MLLQQFKQVVVDNNCNQLLDDGKSKFQVGNLQSRVEAHPLTHQHTGNEKKDSKYDFSQRKYKPISLISKLHCFVKE